MLENVFLSSLELNWSQRSQTDVCRQVLSSSTQRQNRSFHVDDNGYEMSKLKVKYARAKPAAKLLFFVVKYSNC